MAVEHFLLRGRQMEQKDKRRQRVVQLMRKLVDDAGSRAKFVFSFAQPLDLGAVDYVASPSERSFAETDCPDDELHPVAIAKNKSFLVRNGHSMRAELVDGLVVVHGALGWCHFPPIEPQGGEL